MKTILLTSVSVIFLTLASCTDFLNSKTRVPDTSGSTQDKAENLPFPEGYNPHNGLFSPEKMLANIGAYVLYPKTSSLRLNSEILLQSIQQLLVSPENTTQWTQAQEVWKTVMLNYHFLDAAPIGPLSDPQLRLGEQIYSWPYMNLCGVDHEVLKASQNPIEYKVPELFTLKGLAVLEYLLFDNQLQTQCNPRNPRNQIVMDWTQKSDLKKKGDRLNYARLITHDLIKNTKALENLWNPESYNFTYRLISGRLNLSLKEAVNSLSDSLFSIEEVKDQKLGKPLGLYKDCQSENKKCPESIEHLWSHLTFDAIQAQIKGFESVFFGYSFDQNYDGFGFDDYLVDMKRADVVESMRQNLNYFYTSLQNVQSQGNMASQVQEMNVVDCQGSNSQNRLVPVCSLFHDLRIITTKMKTEFLTALSLRSPPTYQGDND